MINRVALLMLIGTTLVAADFQTGQAARAVIGQDSFSARDSGVSVTAMTVSNGQLHAAVSDGRLLTFDLTRIPGAREDLVNRQGTTCTLCGFSPIGGVEQAVLPGIAAVSVHGKTVVIADTRNHHVLVWRDTSAPGSASASITLGRSGDTSSVSASTLIDPISVAYDGTRLFVGDAALHRVLVWNSIPKIDNQPADMVLGQADFTSIKLAEVPGPDTIARPTALVSDGANLYVADAINRRILVFTPADIPLPQNAAVNSASLSPGPLAPGTLITIAGSGLSDSSEIASDDGGQHLPKKLAGVEVLFNGVALPVLAASPSEIRAQIPYDTGNASSANLYLRTEHSDGTVTTTTAVPLRLAPVSPGLFAFGGSEPRSALVLHSGSGAAEQTGAPVTADSVAKPGEVLVLWAAGLGPVNDNTSEQASEAGVPFPGSDGQVVNSVSALVNGQPAQVISATLPQNAVGIYEVRVLLPPNLPANPKTQLLIAQDTYVSNTVTFPVGASVQ